MARIIPVLHNVSSVQRVVDMARLAYSLGFEVLVVTKAYGGAAQAGVPEAMRLALRENKTLIVLPDLGDAIELLKPETVILVTHDYAEERIPPSEIAGLASGTTIIAFSGADPDFSPQELRLATRRLYPAGTQARLGSVAEASIILYHAVLASRGGSGGDG